MSNLLNIAERKKHIGLLISLVALGLGLIFSYIVYPRIAKPYNAILDTDRYSPLAMGIWKNGTLSYYPDAEPTVERGPAYPAFLAGLLFLSDGWYPESVWLAQSLLFALTCMLVFWTSNRLWGKRWAIIASLMCTSNPFLLWYTSRVWVELFATFVFTALVAAVANLFFKPSLPRGVLAGVIVGILAVAKATFLPLVVVVPALTGILRTKGFRIPVLMFVASVFIISPWLIRNYNLTNRVLPLQVLTGYNLQRGDSYLEHWQETPFSIRGLWERGSAKIDSMVSDVPEGIPRYERECITDSIWKQRSIQIYLSNPAFLFKKIALNSILFWTLGETMLKSTVISLCNLPLLTLFAIVVIRLLRSGKLTSLHTLIIATAMTYFLIHLPIMAFARLSVVLVPTMSIFAALVLGGGLSIQERGDITNR